MHIARLGMVIGVLSGLSVHALSSAADAPSFNALVLTKTAGFRHDSIPAGVEAIQALGREHAFTVEIDPDASQFTAAGLEKFEVVIFLNTTGDVLNDAQQEALMKFIRDGGGFVGIHAAADTEYDWPWYGKLLGARFAGHPHVQQAVIRVIDRKHPSTIHLPERWSRTDEWYDYRELSDDLRVLALLDESSYEGGAMGKSHPIAWCHEFDGGRAWYTGGGHTSATFNEAQFRQHLLGGIQWAAGCTVPSSSPRDDEPKQNESQGAKP